MGGLRLGQDLPGRDPHLQRDPAGVCTRFGAHFELERGTDGPDRIVLAGNGEPEHCRHPIGICAIDGPAVSLDGVANDLVCLPAPRFEDFRIAGIRGLNDIGTEYGDDPAGSSRDDPRVLG
jgi:hypothetical protein